MGNVFTISVFKNFCKNSWYRTLEGGLLNLGLEQLFGCRVYRGFKIKSWGIIFVIGYIGL